MDGLKYSFEHTKLQLESSDGNHIRENFYTSYINTLDPASIALRDVLSSDMISS